MAGALALDRKVYHATPLAGMHFLYVAPLIFVASVAIITIVSLATAAPDAARIGPFVWRSSVFAEESARAGDDALVPELSRAVVVVADRDSHLRGHLALNPHGVTMYSAASHSRSTASRQATIATFRWAEGEAARSLAQESINLP